jgi:nitroreductase
MTNDAFKQLQSIILSRRSVSAPKMNGKAIPDETVKELIALADWAPTHGRTEPWRFYVYTGAALKSWSQAHADLYWENTAEDKRQEATKDKLLHMADNASHLLVSVMKRGANVKIPLVEEIAAASAATEHILLGATALGIASFWSTGGMCNSQALKDHLQLNDEDHIMGLIYLGFTDEPAKEGVRNTPLDEKIHWAK